MNDFLKKVLPYIGAAATGGIPALIGMAAKTVGEVLGAEVGASPDAITQAVLGATPEQMLLLKKAEQDFTLQMQAMGFKQVTDLENIAAADRSSARSREELLRDSTPSVLAGVVTIGFFGVLSYMLSYGVPAKGGEALLVLLGALGSAWGSVMNYYYGSSSGSAAKNEIIAKQTK